MPIIAIKVPGFLKEQIPNEVFYQVRKTQGYEEQNLHISLAIIDYDHKNEFLSKELLTMIQSILDSKPIPSKIILNGPDMISKYNYGMAVKGAMNSSLEEIYDEINKVVFNLQQKYGENTVQLRQWKPYQAHVSFFGQISEPLKINNESTVTSEFLTTEITLRHNETTLHQFQIHPAITLDNANQIFDKASEYHNRLKTNYLNNQGLIKEIRENYAAAEYYYKNLDKNILRIRCLIRLGQLNTLQSDQAYGAFVQSTFLSYFIGSSAKKSVSEEEIMFRLRNIDYAVNIVSSLSFLSQYEQDFGEEVKNFLQDSLRLFFLLKKNGYEKYITLNDLAKADEKIKLGLVRIEQLEHDNAMVAEV
jgi:hypothetical protein